MKNENPLYVVKGDNVEEAKNLLDLFIKKLNLGPVLEVLQNILMMLMENVQSYAAFVAVQDFLDFIIQKIELFRKYSIV